MFSDWQIMYSEPEQSWSSNASVHVKDFQQVQLPVLVVGYKTINNYAF